VAGVIGEKEASNRTEISIVQKKWRRCVFS
jgi:hypothetical protein